MIRFAVSPVRRFRARLARRRGLFAAVAAVGSLLAGPLSVAATPSPVRTLDDVSIEGEVHLPQVLFISSREADRPLELPVDWALPTTADLGRDVSVPWAIRRHVPIPIPMMPASMIPAVVPDLETPDALSVPAEASAPVVPPTTDTPHDPTREVHR